MSLRFRINLLVTCLSLLFVAALGAVLVDNFRSSIREETMAATRVTVQMLRAIAAAADAGALTPGSDARLESFVKTLGRVRSNDIFIYRGSELVYTSPPPTYKAGRSAPEWFAGLVGPSISVTEIRARGVRIVVLPDPSRAVLDAWDEIRTFAWMILGFFAVLNGLIYWFLGRSLRPVNEVVEALSHMELGKFQARLPRFSLPELTSISDSFNRMAERLERSLSENRLLMREQELGQVIQQHLEAERKAIARELHDELGQCLTAIRTIAVTISNRTRDKQAELHGSAETIASVAGHAYESVHRIVHRLRPPAMEHSGLAEVLRDLVANWKSRHPGVETSVETGPGVEQAGETVVFAVFRVVQECLTNVAKHAGATRVEIRVERVQDTAGAPPKLDVTVRDNGAGMDPGAAESAGRYGIVGMRERVEALKGKFELDSAPGQGVCVRVSLPLADETDERGLPWLFA